MAAANRTISTGTGVCDTAGRNAGATSRAITGMGSHISGMRALVGFSHRITTPRANAANSARKIGADGVSPELRARVITTTYPTPMAETTSQPRSNRASLRVSGLTSHTLASRSTASPGEAEGTTGGFFSGR